MAPTLVLIAMPQSLWQSVIPMLMIMPSYIPKWCRTPVICHRSLLDEDEGMSTTGTFRRAQMRRHTHQLTPPFSLVQAHNCLARMHKHFISPKQQCPWYGFPCSRYPGKKEVADSSTAQYCQGKGTIQGASPSPAHNTANGTKQRRYGVFMLGEMYCS